MLLESKKKAKEKKDLLLQFCCVCKYNKFYIAVRSVVFVCEQPCKIASPLLLLPFLLLSLSFPFSFRITILLDARPVSHSIDFVSVQRPACS